jgi:hypothetical protein
VAAPVSLGCESPVGPSLTSEIMAPATTGDERPSGLKSRPSARTAAVAPRTVRTGDAGFYSDLAI